MLLELWSALVLSLVEAAFLEAFSTGAAAVSAPPSELLSLLLEVAC